MVVLVLVIEFRQEYLILNSQLEWNMIAYILILILMLTCILRNHGKMEQGSAASLDSWAMYDGSDL